MPDLSHTWGNDLDISPTGDLAVVDGADLGRQRLIRRLMTAANRRDARRIDQPGEYIWHPTYGGSVPQRIGDTLDIDLLTSLIRAQVGKEAAVAKIPLPVITLTPFLNGVSVDIRYADALTGRQTSLSFDLTK